MQKDKFVNTKSSNQPLELKYKSSHSTDSTSTSGISRSSKPTERERDREGPVMVGRWLTYVVGFTVLTCALTVSSSTVLQEDDPRDLKIAQVTDSRHHNLLGTATEQRFLSFMRKYEKEYSTREEYVHRLGVFAENLLRAAEHQALDPTAVHGITPFFDLSADEFEEMYMGVRGGRRLKGVGKAPPMEVGGLPESFDWRERGAVTEVKMQVYE